jgi:hypothetical protein
MMKYLYSKINAGSAFYEARRVILLRSRVLCYNYMMTKILLLMLFLLLACAQEKEDNLTPNPTDSYAITLSMTRTGADGLDPFNVTAALTLNGTAFTGAALTIVTPKGVRSVTTDNGDGSYSFTVDPATNGVYPVTVSYGNATIKRDAVVIDTLLSGIGQPMAVPGDYVNTAGYEDGITVTADGEYIFVQYGPFYFTGLSGLSIFCAAVGYTAYDTINCASNDNSNWVFDTIGPYADIYRPGFNTEVIAGGSLTHTNLVIPGFINGIALFPTFFYGFKRQSDGTYAEPFRMAFNNDRSGGIFGLSFVLTAGNTATFAMSWDDYTNPNGDSYNDLYTGTMTLGEDKNLGEYVYTGDVPSTITPNVDLVNLPSHLNTQGNSHLHADSGGVITSVWVDDEHTTHNLTLYEITAGTFPTGTHTVVTLPAKINTAGEESMPFFTGSKLYMRRDNKIVYHDYTGTGSGDFNLTASWGNEVVVFEVSAGSTDGHITALGEPTIASYDGKTYLYFGYFYVRAQGLNGYVDLNGQAGFVELP